MYLLTKHKVNMALSRIKNIRILNCVFDKALLITTLRYHTTIHFLSLQPLPQLYLNLLHIFPPRLRHSLTFLDKAFTNLCDFSFRRNIQEGLIIASWECLSHANGAIHNPEVICALSIFSTIVRMDCKGYEMRRKRNSSNIIRRRSSGCRTSTTRRR